MIKNFRNIVNKSTLDRKKLCIPPLPLNIKEVDMLCKILEKNEYNYYDEYFLLSELKTRIIPGVDETSYLKANFLNKICNNKIQCDIIDKQHAIYILGTMQGGYNVDILVGLLENEELAEYAYKQLKNTILIFDHYNVVEQYYKKGNPWAKLLLESWANSEWFINKPKIKDKIPLTIFKVNGETNTDDLSPAQDAWSRPDIPLHARAMLKCPRESIIPNIDYEVGPLNQIELLKQKKIDIAYVGDIVGTGSSRKSATNSILWHFGKKIMYVPNKKIGGYCFGGKIAPIFLSTMEDSGAFPIEMDVSKLEYGQNIDLYPYEGIVTEHNTNKVITDWKMHSETLLDSVRAGGRIQLMIGKALTQKACTSLDLHKPSVFIERNINDSIQNKYTLAQKIVGKACNLPGVLPGTYCEPLVTSVGSQDTTGPMTRDELKDLACLGFSADLVMQSFCHTSAYPKPVDVITHNTLPDFIKNRGGISLKPGDGIIHSWLNRMLLPDTVGTGGDSHTRFPIGISFPAGSGLVAFSAATGMMPLDMPESVLVKFSGKMQHGITLRDVVHSIPYYARKQGLLTLDKKDKKNIFNGNILEIQGLPDLTCEQAFELSDASAERSSAGCTIQLNKNSVIEYLTSNISLLHWMIKEGYGDKNTINRRIEKMQKWLDEPILLEPDDGACYKETIHIDLNDIKEPILCAPNDPDHAVLLSEVENTHIQEVFIGSCMTNIGHFRAAGELLKTHEDELNTTLWIAPPTKMDEKVLKEEGYYDIFKKHNLNIEMPGCSLCMGNQARVEDNSTVLSTSTRNFPNRLGKGANVFLASAELSAISAIEGKIPDYNTYMNYMNRIQKNHDTIFNYMNFDKMKDYIK
tara:strand:+ start:1700 stop:4282 length:2583 start_codon:yes stop_codon:yes gene_type:complete